MRNIWEDGEGSAKVEKACSRSLDRGGEKGEDSRKKRKSRGAKES